MTALTRIPDPWEEGLAQGWRVTDAARLTQDLTMRADVVIVGSGAGGGMAAEVLAARGLSVIMIEEGGLKSSRDFHLLEREAYPALYQESAARKTADRGITILQGRTVGGSSTVNWTSSFRTPEATLAWWREQHGLKTLTDAELAPWFTRAEARLGVADWLVEPNANNQVLGRGCRALGIPYGQIRRNVRGCWNLGYCGMGCATNAKQSMLVTTIPAALRQGAHLLTRLRVESLALNAARDQVAALHCLALADDGLRPSGRTVTVQARQVVLSAGAIGTPALLLRSQAPDPHGVLGRRTFLHPVALSGARFKQRVDAFDGAPQTLYSDHFMYTQAIDGPLGYKLEVPPVHPLILSATLSGFGTDHAALMRDLPQLQVMLALVRDGFHPDSQGGVVQLTRDGAPQLDYPLNDVVWDALRRGWLTMAELQFAAGAESVLTVHESARRVGSWREAQRLINALPLESGLARVVSAHVMGGAAMSADERAGVVDHQGRHWQLANLTIIDGSVFPTSVGANPQLSVYAFSLRAAEALAARLGAAGIQQG
ncbi:MAG: GMC family oxidoreductase [Paludibacterium sp.]|uniref:GMC family oxidoreductase n=1 Tax=Paludibacterium sp. TaxID=1917523 RepID=UPI0025D9A65A|nr:GMC family oxidoreductase [Paludibacterium sp.]MBV8045898.1 GMC family oxidoreductase [Paludibacterium sp.]MBV8646441.1 GMC family oxidoreductase [Paludibacterium sp.]